MSTAYYYFAASLPVLDFTGPPPMAVKDFLVDCERLCSPEDFRKITNALYAKSVSAEDTGILKSWRELLHNIRNEAAWVRAEKMDRDPMDELRGPREVDPFISAALSQAAQAPNPLAAEKVLDQAKWERLEEWLQGHYFDFEYIFVYALKLQILERYRIIDSPKGQDVFKDLKAAAFH